MDGSGNRKIDRDVPQYQVPAGTTLISWVKENPDELCKRIVESAEWAKHLPAERIPVLMLVEPSGVHLFQIGMREGIIESLKKAQEYYVKIENYESAAQSRDLIEHFTNEFITRQSLQDGLQE